MVADVTVVKPVGWAVGTAGMVADVTVVKPWKWLFGIE